MSLADCLRKLPFFNETERQAIIAGGGRSYVKSMMDEAIANRNEIRDLARLKVDGPVALAPVVEKAPSQEVLFSTPRFFSPLSKQIESARIATQPAAQWKAWLASNAGKLGIKKDEIEWSGINDFLDMKGKAKVTREEITAFLSENGTRVEDVMLGSPDVSEGYLDVLLFDNDIFSEDELAQLSYDEKVNAASNEGLIDPDAENAATKFSQYVVPGGENYRELLVTLPGREPRTLNDIAQEMYGKRFSDLEDEEANRVAGTEQREKKALNFWSSHWPGQPNILTHIRFDERNDSTGAKVLFIQEIQSDWSAKGKKDGFLERFKPEDVEQITEGMYVTRPDMFWYFKVPDNTLQIPKSQYPTVESARKYILTEKSRTGSTVPLGPFVTETKSYVALGLKRAIMWAVQNGHDKIAWANGQQNADHYDLSKQISKLEWLPTAVGVGTEKSGVIRGWDLNGSNVLDKNATENELPDIVGKDVAEKIVGSEPSRTTGSGKPVHTLEGIDLKIGGEGMKAFYDQIVPQVANDVLKRLGGGKVETVSLPGAGGIDAKTGVVLGPKAKGNESRMQQQGFTIATAMAEKVATEGVPLFSNRRQTETEEFKKWFGDSLVVDEQGKPLVVYHGTVVRSGPKTPDMGDIKAFDRFYTTRFRGHSLDTVGSWFSSNPGKGGAEMYSGASDGSAIYPAYLSIKNPQVTTFHLLQRRARLLANGKDDGRRIGEAEVNAYRKWLKETGKDGIKIESSGNDGSTEFDNQVAWIALDPEQIKSATGNNGQFDGSNPDITRSSRRFEPKGHGQYVSELKSALSGLTSADPRLKSMAGARDFKVMDTPYVLQALLRDDGSKPFKAAKKGLWGTGSSIASKATDTHQNSRHGGAIDPKIVIDLPRFMADPLAIFSGEGGDNANSFRVVLPIRYNNANPVVAVEPKGERGFVLTVHPGGDAQLKRWASEGLARYVNDKPSEQARTDQSRALNKEGVDLSIAQSAAESKGHRVVTKSDIDEMPDAAFYSPRRSVITQQPIQQAWSDPPVVGKWDAFIRTYQDKLIDTKQVVKAIREAGIAIRESIDPYMQEVLFHGRAAKRVSDFADNELRPMLVEMAARGIDRQQFEDYLWARHAAERNAQIAAVNPNMPDGGSGLTNQQARDILAGRSVRVNGRDIQINPAHNAGYQSLAAKIDAITKGTTDLLVSYGLETQATVNQWRQTYGKYVPLMRDMESDDNYAGAFNLGLGTGQGFSVKGSAAKRAMGSERSVTDILANVAMQRERAIVRGEKNRVSQAVYGLAVTAPNPDFWLPIDPDGTKDPKVLINGLVTLGINPIDAENIAYEPKQQYVDPRTGMTAERVNPALRSRDDVLAVRINGVDRYVMFSSDERSQEMVRNLKNLDNESLGAVMQKVAVVTRWFASINTQYNPVFGLTNGIRDLGTGLLNLESTDLKGNKAEVVKNAFSALRGIYADLRDHRAGRQPTSAWALEFEEFALEGGQTGYRDMFQTSEARTKALMDELKNAAKGKSWLALDEKRSPLFGWLSDYNTSIENAIRVSAYKVAKDKGMSKQAAAYLAKNLTVNFNKKGLAATQMGAMYAFFNAAVQGTARIAQTTLKMENGRPTLTKAGKAIIYGGAMLGVMQAVMFALAGWDDEEPPQFVREKNFIIPLANGKYLSIPYPLGYHVIPNVTRIAGEFVLNGFKNPGKRMVDLFSMILDGYNPLGSTGGSLTQMLSPTITDPLVALSENKDWTGKPIYREDFNKMHPTAGWTRTKDTASDVSKWLSYGINYMTGGGKYEIGIVSPTPDQIDYLIGQATGGVGRESLKVWQAGSSAVSGEELPMHKVPVVGRFVGDTTGQASQSSRFYSNLKRIGEHKSALDEMKDAKDAQAKQEYLAEHPEARLVKQADKASREIGYLKRQKRDMLERGASKEMIQLKERQITEKIRAWNLRLGEEKD